MDTAHQPRHRRGQLPAETLQPAAAFCDEVQVGIVQPDLLQVDPGKADETVDEWIVQQPGQACLAAMVRAMRNARTAPSVAPMRFHRLPHKGPNKAPPRREAREAKKLIGMDSDLVYHYN